MNEPLLIDGIPILITRKRMKNLYLRVSPPDGSVRVSAPLHTSNARIEAFVRSRMDWLTRQRERWADYAPTRVATGESMLLFGERVTLQVTKRAGKASVARVGDTLNISLSSDDPGKRTRALNDYLRTELLGAANALLPACEEIVGKRASALCVRDMTSRWGSCNTATAKITLNLQLVHKPLASLNYILLHELTHLHVARHDARFWARMDVYCPDWKQQRAFLRTSGV